MTSISTKIVPDFDIKPYHRIIYGIILVIAFLWCAGIIAAPLWANQPGIQGSMSDFLYSFYSKSCHQRSIHSLFIDGSKLGVCSRCTMIYFGFLFTTILYPFVKTLSNLYMPPIWILLTAAALVALDAGLDALDIVSNTFASREITGALVGLILPFYIIPGSLRMFYEFFEQSEVIPKK